MLAHPFPKRPRRSQTSSETCVSVQVIATSLSEWGPLSPTLRANPYPEVTDLFCRLPLSTLFYRLEAAHLGDLRRLWVRPGVRINHAIRFSRVVGSAPDSAKITLLSQPVILIAGQSDSKDHRNHKVTVKKKRELFPGLPPTSLILLVLPLNIHFLVREY